MKQRLILIFTGGLWGCISFYWLLVSLVLAFPFSYPGSYEYELEDRHFIPYGYLGLAVYAFITVAAIILNRKKPKRIAFFAIPAVCTLAASILILVM